MGRGVWVCGGGDHLIRGLGQTGGGDHRQTAGGQHTQALGGVGALQTDHDGDGDAHLADRLHDPLGDQVAADDAAEDVDQDGAYLGVGQDQLEGLGDALRCGAAADVEEVGGAAAVELDQIHGGHGQSGPIDHAAMLPSRLM